MTVIFRCFVILGGLGEIGDQSVSLGRLRGTFGGDFGRLLGDSGRLWGGRREEEKKRRREGKNMEVAHLNFVTLCKLICMFHCMAAA